MQTTHKKSSLSRRSFLANAATAGAVLPSLLDAAVAGSPLVATEAEPLRLHRNESSYGLHPAAAEALRSTNAAALAAANIRVALTTMSATGTQDGASSERN